MNGPRDYHTEWSKSDREGGRAYDIPYLRNLKRNDANELTKQRLTDLENELTGAGLKDGGEGIVREFGIDMYTLLF